MDSIHVVKETILTFKKKPFCPFPTVAWFKHVTNHTRNH